MLQMLFLQSKRNAKAAQPAVYLVILVCYGTIVRLKARSEAVIIKLNIV